MRTIDFRPVTLADRETVRTRVYESECRNCDLNFMNLMSWRFLYGTEMALHDGWLLFRFRVNGHVAYLAPVGKGEWAPVLHDMLDDVRRLEQPFLMLGVCENSLTFLNAALPGYFYAMCDRSYTDYIYRREALATLAGKKLQAKRNHVNRFVAQYPDFEYLPLTSGLVPECMRLAECWAARKAGGESRLTHADEHRSMSYVFDNWDALGATGGVIRAGGRIVAFTYGAPVNYDTFDVCAEKADTACDGAYAVINREFARRIPEQYIYINREEDLGIEGLRKAKESYRPEMLLHKYTVMTKHPLG